ncbi:MAG: hypothetical protein H0T58_07785 [Gemmatimonadales bacterium]|nr:hypothetical protein [Gemmatimonadales bacterium]
MAHWNMPRTGRASVRLIVLGLLLFAGLILVVKLTRQPNTPAAAVDPSTQPRAGNTAARPAPQPAPAENRRATNPTPAPEAPSRPISPTDPLPPAAVAAGDNAEEQAADLAGQFLAGGGRAFPALVAAVQLAGFSIRNPDGTMALQPEGPSQGIAFERYEVNALAELARERRTVSVPLSSFAAELASPLSQLQDAPMVDLLLDGIRQHAVDSVGPLPFWAMFIVELGRQAKAHPPYDLLANVDSARVQLDALQMAFLAKRLAGDMVAAAHQENAGQKSVGMRRTLPVFLAAYTQSSGPCTFEDDAGKIVDLAALGTTTAFGELLEYLDSKGVKGAEGMGKFANYANLVLAYLQLVISHLAFDMQFEMQSEPPLVRTRDMRPKVGETKTLVTTVKMNLGKIEWINCLRMPLNAMGLDFSVDGDGPVEGASVSWTASAGFSDVAIYRGGTEQLVRYVTNDDSRIQTGGSVTGGHSITDQSTDSEGRARVQVEGVGQRANLGREPRPVMKNAVAAAQVVLKPANMFRDLKDAVSTASGGLSGLLTMPAELLYRTRWTFGGWYDFPVRDWKAGNGWSGWVSYTRIEQQRSSEKRQSICCGGQTTNFQRSYEDSETLNHRWDIPSDTDSKMLTPGFSMATAAYTLTGNLTKSRSSFHTGWASCRGGRRPQTSRGHQETTVAQVDYQDEAEVTVQLEPDSSFLITAGGPNGRAEGEIVTTKKDDRNDGCNGQKPTRTQTYNGTYRPGTWAGHIKGKADPNTDVLRGSETRTKKYPHGTTITHIHNWELHR